MQFNQDVNNQDIQITSYQPGSLIIGEKNYTNNLVLANGKALEGLLPESINDFNNGHLQRLIELSPDVIILGSGEKLVFPEPEIMGYALSRQIGLEVMNTSAACRTYNVLLSESRNVLAALLIKNEHI